VRAGVLANDSDPMSATRSPHQLRRALLGTLTQCRWQLQLHPPATTPAWRAQLPGARQLGCGQQERGLRRDLGQGQQAPVTVDTRSARCPTPRWSSTCWATTATRIRDRPGQPHRPAMVFIRHRKPNMGGTATVNADAPSATRQAQLHRHEVFTYAVKTPTTRRPSPRRPTCGSTCSDGTTGRCRNKRRGEFSFDI